MINVKTKWRKEYGVIYLSLTSDGTNGPEWASRLKSKDFLMSSEMEMLLGSTKFLPTEGVEYEISILSWENFDILNRKQSNIIENAKNRELYQPSIELACMLREVLDKDSLEIMGFNNIMFFPKSFGIDSYLYFNSDFFNLKEDASNDFFNVRTAYVFWSKK